MKTLRTLPNELSSIDIEFDKLYYEGDETLLEREKISIVGSRRPYNYTKNVVYELAKKLSQKGLCIVSGAAMGVDAIAHRGAGASNTIAVLGSGVDMPYPKINKNLIEDIKKNGLVLSQFEPGFIATPWSFVLRNKIVVALGKVLVVAQADLDSGSMRSVEFALKQGKEIYVLPHRLKESEGTNGLLKEGLAKAIYDIDEFVSKMGSKGQKQEMIKDEFWQFCANFPKYDDAIKAFGDRVSMKLSLTER